MKDEQNIVLTLQKAVASIVRAGNFTIISMEDVYLGEGVLGGYVTSGFAQGKVAANLTLQILQGNSPSSIPLVKVSPNEFMFNYPQLERLGITISQLPAKSIILNRPQSFYERYKLRIWVAVLFLIFQTFAIFALTQNILKRKKAEASLQKARDDLEQRVIERTTELSESNAELQKALDEVKTLRGIIPICSNCKKIRDDQGFWKQIELYIMAHSEAEFSHGICQECAKKLYPEFVDENGHFNKK